MTVIKSILWGVIGGLVGGIISLLFFFTAPYAHYIFTSLTVVNPLQKIAGMSDNIFRTGDELIWGYVGHFIVSTLYGFGFGIFNAFFKPKNWKFDLIIGFFFGLIYTLIGPFLMMPLIMGMNQFIFNFSNIQLIFLEICIHQAFTLPMALIFGLGMRIINKKETTTDKDLGNYETI